MAQAIIAEIGGITNVSNITHCMTRLRFVLKDNQLANLEAIKKIKGVLGVIDASGQIQVIIGNNVGYAYTEILKLGDFGEQSDIAKGTRKQKITLKTIWNSMIDALIGTMSPIIPPIIGGSMIKLIAMMLAMAGVISDKSSTYNILTAIGDAVFYFLPMMVAVSAAKKFKCNTYLAIAIAGVLVHPTFIDLMAQAAKGTEITLGMIPILSVKYTYTVIPALIMTWVLSYIEHWIDHITPAIFKNFLKPLLIMLIAAPIAIVVIGPLGIYIGTGISKGVFIVHDHLGWLAVAIMGALWPLLVMTSMHRVFTPTIISTIAETGTEGVVMPCELGANLAQGGASLAVAYKTKNLELRQTALAAAASALIAGITEPAMYGVTLRLKRPLIAVLITGFICGAIAGMAGLASRSMASPGLFTSVQFFNPNDSSAMIWVGVIIVVAIVLSFILTLLLGFEDIPEDIDATAENAVQNTNIQTVATHITATESTQTTPVPDLRNT